MNLINDVYFLFSCNWGNLYFFTQVTHVINAIVTGSVNLDDIKMRFVVVVRQFVNLMCKNACNRGLANSTGTSEKIGVRDVTLLE